MLIRTAALSVLLICSACTSAPEEIVISNGMTKEEFLKAANQAGATDITGGLQLSGTRKELFWEFKPYGLVIQSDFKDNKLREFRIWTVNDFNTPRGERYEKGVAKSTLRINPETKKYTTE